MQFKMRKSNRILHIKGSFLEGEISFSFSFFCPFVQTHGQWREGGFKWAQRRHFMCMNWSPFIYHQPGSNPPDAGSGPTIWGFAHARQFMLGPTVISVTRKQLPEMVGRVCGGVLNPHLFKRRTSFFETVTFCTLP